MRRSRFITLTLLAFAAMAAIWPDAEGVGASGDTLCSPRVPSLVAAGEDSARPMNRVDYPAIAETEISGEETEGHGDGSRAPGISGGLGTIFERDPRDVPVAGGLATARWAARAVDLARLCRLLL